MPNSFGKLFTVTTWGESHGAGVGAVVDGCPPRLPLDVAEIQAELDRRRPGQSDIVTPRKGTSIMDPGEAHIVITVRDLDAHDFAFDGQPCSANYGKRLDLRVLRWSDGRFVPFWVESAEFEPWVDPQAQVTIALGEVAA